MLPTSYTIKITQCKITSSSYKYENPILFLFNMPTNERIHTYMYKELLPIAVIYDEYFYVKEINYYRHT